jgi:hypothetical protein
MVGSWKGILLICLILRSMHDPYYATLCQQICAGGYTDTEKVSKDSYTHIGASQIKSVTLTLVASKIAIVK